MLKSGLHKLCAQLRLYTQSACKWCNMYTKICAQYWLLCVKIIESANLPHRSLCFQKIRKTTTTAFLTSNTAVPNPYSHSTAFNPQSFAPVCLTDLSQSDIQILYSLQIDNGIPLCKQQLNFQEQVRGPWSVHKIPYTTSHFILSKMVALFC